MGIPVSLKGHQHICPQDKHVGGPIQDGDSTLTVNGIAVALVGHRCECRKDSPDIITGGTSLLTVNGIQVALVGSPTAHGGKVVEGDATLTIG